MDLDLDAFDAELAAAEAAVRALEEELSECVPGRRQQSPGDRGAAADDAGGRSPGSGRRVRGERTAGAPTRQGNAVPASPQLPGGRLPGRCCRAVPALTAGPKLPSSRPEQTEKKPGARSATFGSEKRTCAPRAGQLGGRARESKVENSDGWTEKEAQPQILHPSDKFLSTKATPRCATIWPSPTPAKIGKRKLEPAVAYAAPGLRGVVGAWLALVREALRKDRERYDPLADDSTQAGSELGELSVLSEWSTSSTPSRYSVPGPGAYSPAYAAIASNTSRGTPSFSRYSARDPAAGRGEEDELRLPRQEEMNSAKEPLLTRGGFIAKLPSSTPRAPTVRAADERAAARRPFYDRSGEPVAEEASLIPFGGSSGSTHRLDKLRPRQALGPGAYELPEAPAGPAAFIAPEPMPAAEPTCKPKPSPGPADYECQRADDLVFAGRSSVYFRSSTGHTMAFQKAPRYVALYEALDPRWAAVRRRSLSAVILPKAAQPVQTSKPSPGPGHYMPAIHDAGGGEALVRMRPDVRVHRWAPRTDGRAEHIAALFTDRPVDPTVRGDRREMLGFDDDLALRRRRPAPVIHPLSKSLPNWPREEGVWRLYDPPAPPSPEGNADFSRRVPFEDFQAAEALWEARRLRLERRLRPSSRLVYSLPELEVTHARAPAVDFTRVPGRPASEPGDLAEEPREGDVLLLDTCAERELFHPRSVCYVDMARAQERAESLPLAHGDTLVDDFEELVLEPKPVQARTPMFVDMARATSRPEEPRLSANLWCDADGVLYAYQPTAGLRLRDPSDAELDLSGVQRSWEHLQRRSPRCDFGKPLGRPGIDPSVDDVATAAADAVGDGDVLLTSWAPPLRQIFQEEAANAPRGPGDV